MRLVKDRYVRLGDGKILRVPCEGLIKIGDHHISALYCPQLRVNLLSVGALLLNGNTVKTYARDGKLYKMRLPTEALNHTWALNSDLLQADGPSEDSSSARDTRLDLHRLLGHASEQSLKHVEASSRNVPIGDHNCAICVKGKHVQSYKSRKSYVARVLERIDSDLIGPLPQAFNDKKYLVTFIDETSRYAWCFPIANKSEYLQVFENFKNKLMYSSLLE